MNILEKDLFNFIFYPEVVKKEIYEYISSNIENYKSEIELLRNIKKGITKKFSDNLIKRIVDRIKMLERNTVVLLERINYKDDSIAGQLVLSADSPELEQTLRTDTYQDKKCQYLVKIITDKEKSKIFLFNKDNSEMKNIKINVEPSGDSFVIKSSNDPCIIVPKQDITNISLISDN